MEEFGIIMLILSLIALGLWIYAIYDIVKGSLSGNTTKIIWLIVVIFFPIIGALLYLIFGRSSSSGRSAAPPGNTTSNNPRKRY